MINSPLERYFIVFSQFLLTKLFHETGSSSLWWMSNLCAFTKPKEKRTRTKKQTKKNPLYIDRVIFIKRQKERLCFDSLIPILWDRSEDITEKNKKAQAFVFVNKNISLHFPIHINLDDTSPEKPSRNWCPSCVSRASETSHRSTLHSTHLTVSPTEQWAPWGQWPGRGSKLFTGKKNPTT